MTERIDPRARFAAPVRGESAEPVGGVSSVNPYLLLLALTAESVRQAVEEERAAERLVQMLAEGGVREPDSRMSKLSKREHLNVADLTGRRHGRTYGPSKDGWIPVKWLDTGERVRVRESDLLLRYTVQSVGFVPKSERDAEVAEEAASAMSEEEVSA